MSTGTPSPTASFTIGTPTELDGYWISIALGVAMLASFLPCVGYCVVGCCIRPCVVLPLCDRSGPCRGVGGGGSANSHSSAACTDGVQSPAACVILAGLVAALVVLATAPFWIPILSLVLAIRNGAVGMIVLAGLILACVYVVILPSVTAAAFAPMCCAPHSDNFACEDEEHKRLRLAPERRAAAAAAKASKAAAAAQASLEATERGERKGSISLLPVVELVAPAPGSRVSKRISRRFHSTNATPSEQFATDGSAGSSSRRKVSVRRSGTIVIPSDSITVGVRPHAQPGAACASPLRPSSSGAPPGRLPRAAPAAPAAHAGLIDQLFDSYGRPEALRMYMEICGHPASFVDDPRPLVRRIAAAELASQNAGDKGAAPLPTRSAESQSVRTAVDATLRRGSAAVGSVFEMTIDARPGEKLGIGLGQARRDGNICEVEIVTINPDGAVMRLYGAPSSAVNEGDVIVTVSGEDVRGMNVHEVHARIKSAPRPVRIGVCSPVHDEQGFSM